MSRTRDDDGHSWPASPAAPERAVRMRLRYANVTSTVALVIALTGGTAYAASAIVDRAKLANNALALGGFNAARYRQDVSSATSTAQVAVSPGNWVTVLAWKFTTHRPGYILVLDQLTADDTGKTAGTAEVRLVLNGKPEGGVATYPIGPDCRPSPDTSTAMGFLPGTTRSRCSSASPAPACSSAGLANSPSAHWTSRQADRPAAPTATVPRIQ